MPGNHADQEEADRMLAEIGGDITDLQPPLRIGIIRRFGQGLIRCAMARVPDEMVALQVGRAARQIILPGQQQVAVDLRVVAAEEAARGLSSLAPASGSPMPFSSTP